MGIETILIVLGVVVVIALAVGVSRTKRKVGDAQAPKVATPPSVQKRR